MAQSKARFSVQNAIAVAHEFRVPLDAVTRVEKHRFFVEQANKELPRGNELQRLIAFLKELDRMFDGRRLALERWLASKYRLIRRAQLFHDDPPRLLHVLADQFRIKAVRPLRIDGRPIRVAKLHCEQPPIAAKDLTIGKVLFAPPAHVCRIAEGTDHQDAGTFFRVGKVGGEDGHRDTEERGVKARFPNRCL